MSKLSAMTIGCDKLHFAPLTTDTHNTIEYGAPVPLPGLMKIGISPNSSSATAFFDNGPGEQATTMGAIEVTAEKSALSTAELALILGHMLDTNGALVYGADDTPTEGAVGFRTLKSNGKYKYVWLLKGSFAEPETEVETRGESVNFQNSSLTGNFVKTNYYATVGANKTKQLWKVEIDEEDAITDPTIITNWFKHVYIPGKTAPAVLSLEENVEENV